MDVLVLGGGLSGLACAQRLAACGATVRLVTGDRLGGNISTRTDAPWGEGWLLEEGPNSFGDASTELMDLVRAVGIEDELVGAPDAANRRFLYRRGRLREVPTSPPKFLLSGLLPLGGRLRLMAEPFIRPLPEGSPEESLAAFCDRRLGRAAREKLLTPVVGGIYAGDPCRLGAESAFPRMVAMEREHGSLIRAAIRGNGPPKRGRLSSLRSGLGRLPVRLAEHLGDDVVVRGAASSVTRTASSWTVRAGGRFHEAEHLVVATPAHVAAELLREVAPAVAAEMAAVRSAPMAVVHVGVRTASLGVEPQGFGFLVPRGEGLRILGCIYSSSLFPGRAPRDHDLLTVFAGGDLDPGATELSDDALRDAVLRDLRAALVSLDPVGPPEITRWTRAIPQYEVGHRDRLARIDAAVAEIPGLHLLGNWRGGIAMPDCVRNATALAERIAEGSAP